MIHYKHTINNWIFVMLNIDYKVIETFPQKLRDILDKELVEGNEIVEAWQYKNNSCVVLKYPFMTDPIYDTKEISYKKIDDKPYWKASYTYIDADDNNQRYILVCRFAKDNK